MHNGAIKDISNWLDAGNTVDDLINLELAQPEISAADLSPTDQAPADEPSGIVYRSYTMAELAAMEFVTEYAIEGVYEKMAHLVVGAPKKGLKTNTILDFAVSLASGSPWLGKFRVLQRMRIGVMSGESGMPTIKETIDRICCSKELDMAQVDGLIVTPDLPKISDPAHVDALVEWVKQYKFGAVVLDPFYLLLGGEADVANLFAQGEKLRTIGDAVNSAGAGVVLIHHLKKNTITEANQPSELGDLSHAGIAEWARQWLLWSRRATYQPGTGYHPLWLTVGGSSGHSGLYAVDVNEGAYSPGTPRYWQVDITTAGEARDTAKERRDEERAAKQAKRLDTSMAAIVRAMLTEPLKAGATKTKIKNSTTLNTADFSAAMERLVDTLQVVPCEVMVSNHKNPQAGWILPGNVTQAPSPQPETSDEPTTKTTKTEHKDESVLLGDHQQ